MVHQFCHCYILPLYLFFLPSFLLPFLSFSITNNLFPFFCILSRLCLSIIISHYRFLLSSFSYSLHSSFIIILMCFPHLSLAPPLSLPSLLLLSALSPTPATPSLYRPHGRQEGAEGAGVAGRRGDGANE